METNKQTEQIEQALREFLMNDQIQSDTKDKALESAASDMMNAPIVEGLGSGNATAFLKLSGFKPWYAKWWFLSSIGLVTLVSVYLTYPLLQSEQPAEEPTLIALEENDKQPTENAYEVSLPSEKTISSELATEATSEPIAGGSHKTDQTAQQEAIAQQEQQQEIYVLPDYLQLPSQHYVVNKRTQKHDVKLFVGGLGQQMNLREMARRINSAEKENNVFEAVLLKTRLSLQFQNQLAAFSSDMAYINQASYQYENNKAHQQAGWQVMPSAFYALLDWSKIVDGDFTAKAVNTKDLQNLMQPFYMAKEAVSISRYKDFLNAVCFENTGKSFAKKSKVTATDFTYQFSSKFARRHGIQSPRINVLPFSQMITKGEMQFADVREEMLKSGNRNKAVSGLSYLQVLAYCDWLEQNLNQQLANDGLRIEIDLPSHAQYQFASLMAFPKAAANGEMPLNSDLIFDQHSAKQYLIRNRISPWPDSDYKQFSSEIKSSAYAFGIRPANDVQQLHANVSEWVKSNYARERKPLYKACTKSNALNSDDHTALMLYESGIKDNFKMIIGGNWMDAQARQKRPAISDAYRFNWVNPATQYSTIGFRYVMRIVSE